MLKFCGYLKFHSQGYTNNVDVYMWMSVCSRACVCVCACMHTCRGAKREGIYIHTYIRTYTHIRTCHSGLKQLVVLNILQ